MSTNDHITYLIQAEKPLLEAQIEQECKRKYTLDPVPDRTLRLSQDTLESLREKGSKVSEIEQYLGKLDSDTLLKLKVLLYLDRDKESRLKIKKDLQIIKTNFSKDSKEELIRTIFEKKGGYKVRFDRSLAYLKQKNIDIDKIWSDI